MMSEDLNIKHELLKHCRKQHRQRLNLITTKIKDLEEALSSETKSSAGDKHETGRAMIQLEREKLGYQLAEIQQTINTLQQINPSEAHEKIHLGSVVFTSKLNYFIAVSCGEISCQGNKFYAVSSATPIAQRLLLR
jgi:hypothetical protein